MRLLISVVSFATALVLSTGGNDLMSQTSTPNLNANVPKSIILFTQARSAGPENIERYKGQGVFWGHMPHRSIASDTGMQRWAEYVRRHTANGRYYFGRVEFDWGWMWMIDYMDDVDNYWAKDLNGENISWRGEGPYNGHFHNWQSHHGPGFLAWMKYQIDRMFLAPVTHIMFDSQTSATRTVHWNGGDFSVYAMEGFRAYLAEKYSSEELGDFGIGDIGSFNYREFLLNKGYTLEIFKEAALSIEGDIPLYKDFVYFNRESLNEQMEKVFAYIDTKRPGIEIGATSNLVEPRGYIFSDRMTYLAGEYDHPSDIDESPPFQPILHYKAAEASNKTLIYFPYPTALRDLRERNAPRQARSWIAQAYAMGSVFTIPGRAWMGGREFWDPGWENHYDIYQFIHDNKVLFDDYKALSNTALVYSVYGSLLMEDMHGSKTAVQTIESLVKENISFDLLIFGDPDRPIAPTEEQLKKYNVIFTDSDVQYLTSNQKRLLESAGSKVVPIAEVDQSSGLMSGKIDVLIVNEVHNDIISTLPRISTNPEAPYVIHLLNRKYDPEKDKAVKHEGISVRIPPSFFAEPIKAAILYLPGNQSRDLTPGKDTEGNTILTVGDFNSCWGIVELGH